MAAHVGAAGDVAEPEPGPAVRSSVQQDLAAVVGEDVAHGDMDGPIVPNWAWAGYIQPLEISTEITDAPLDAWKPPPPIQ